MRKTKIITWIGIGVIILVVIINLFWVLPSLSFEKILDLSKNNFVIIGFGLFILLSVIIFYYNSKYFIKKRKEILLLLFSILVSFFLAVIILELQYFLTHQNDDWHDANSEFNSKYGWAPIKNSRTLIFGLHNLSVNEQGFRSETINISKQHILMVGDSVVFGFGVSNNETASYYLDKYLSKIDDKYQVLNLGVSGFGIDQYYLYLSDNINYTNPSYIIVTIYSGNDLEDTRTNNVYGKSKPLFILNGEDIKNKYPEINKYSCFNSLSRLYVAQMFSHNFEIDLHSLCNDETLNQSDANELIVRLLNKLVVVSNSHDSKIFFVLSPSLEDFYNKSEKLIFFENILTTQNISYINFYNYVKEKDINPYDLYLFNDPAHYTVKGNDLMAQAVYDFLIEQEIKQDFADFKNDSVLKTSLFE